MNGLVYSLGELILLRNFFLHASPYRHEKVCLSGGVLPGSMPLPCAVITPLPVFNEPVYPVDWTLYLGQCPTPPLGTL